MEINANISFSFHSHLLFLVSEVLAVTLQSVMKSENMHTNIPFFISLTCAGKRVSVPSDPYDFMNISKYVFSFLSLSLSSLPFRFIEWVKWDGKCSQATTRVAPRHVSVHYFPTWLLSWVIISCHFLQPRATALSILKNDFVPWTRRTFASLTFGFHESCLKALRQIHTF